MENHDKSLTKLLSLLSSSNTTATTTKRKKVKKKPASSATNGANKNTLENDIKKSNKTINDEEDEISLQEDQNEHCNDYDYLQNQNDISSDDENDDNIEEDDDDDEDEEEKFTMHLRDISRPLQLWDITFQGKIILFLFYISFLNPPTIFSFSKVKLGWDIHII